MTTDVTEPATDRPTPDEDTTSGPRRVAVSLFLLLVFAFPTVTVTILANDVETFSVLDEYPHVDVLRRVEDRSYPRLGERILGETAADVGCRGIGYREVGTCDDPPPVERVDATGYNFQAQQPPGYYIPTAMVRQVTKLFADDFVTSARLTGIFWLSGGLAALWFLLGHLGVSLGARAGVVALVAASPLLLYQSATVTNDASLLLLGVALVFGGSLLDARSSWWRVLAVGSFAALAMLVKPTALLAVGAVSLAVVLRGLHDRPRSLRMLGRLALVAAIPSVFALGAVVGWESVRDARAVTPFDEVFDVVLGSAPESDSVTLGEAVELSGRFLGAYSNTTQGGALNDRDYTSGLAQVGFVLLIAGPAAALVLGGDEKSVFGVSALVVAVVGAIVSVYQYHSTYAIEGGAPGRYALVLIPFFAVSLGHLVTHRRFGVAAITGVAGALMAADVVSALAF